MLGGKRASPRAGAPPERTMYPPEPTDNTAKGPPTGEAADLMAHPKLASTASEAEIQEYNKLCMIMETLVSKNDEVDVQDKLAKHIEKESRKKAEDSSYTSIVRNLDYAAAKRKGFTLSEPQGGTDHTDQTVGLEFESFTAMLQDGEAPVSDLCATPPTKTAAVRPSGKEVSQDSTWPAQRQQTRGKREFHVFHGLTRIIVLVC